MALFRIIIPENRVFFYSKYIQIDIIFPYIAKWGFWSICTAIGYYPSFHTARLCTMSTGRLKYTRALRNAVEKRYIDTVSKPRTVYLFCYCETILLNLKSQASIPDNPLIFCFCWDDAAFSAPSPRSAEFAPW